MDLIQYNCKRGERNFIELRLLVSRSSPLPPSDLPVDSFGEDL